MEEIKAGDTVLVNGQQATVTSVEDTSEAAVAAKKKSLEEKQADVALDMWNTLVRNLIRKAKGLKPEEEVDLPQGETGRYIKYALDNQGRLSLGKRTGRLKPRKRTAALALAHTEGAVFAHTLQKLFKEAAETAKANGTEIKALTQEQAVAAKAYAEAVALHRHSKPRKAAAKAARLRRKTARRINAGVINGNQDRRSHASA